VSCLDLPTEYPEATMSLALIIGTIVVTAVTGVVVLALFVWGAVKDGQDQDARASRIQRRSWPRRDT
jgi:hypothetical protein